MTLSDGWQTSNLAFVVFVQSAGSKDVYQSEIISYSDLTITSLEAKSTVPSEFKLEQNYPNPFNPNTTITYTIPVVNAFDASGANVSLKVFNVLGNEIATLVNESKSPGFYSVNFDATGLPSGIYFYRLQVGNFSEVRKMTILK
ncbi:MAG: T9SS type A sorting domain-containing protein [Melioribacteraceae bacterium]|nr:T9SS type A sorting domain-containing protein [Melioribacteraceae bacterium]MCF8265046.1 T9SS type A sorting domain-containing protein [Melioribacteraceae bacterium]MCF8414393.1 T9SS type A sorting domain-containing protein [Melioribacteraceae bacterium]MCF8430963.1 T9SS type A sorting domain-containing protein [Melioribacteraceae bacterium]